MVNWLRLLAARRSNQIGYDTMRRESEVLVHSNKLHFDSG
jgi:hypothetical protein